MWNSPGQGMEPVSTALAGGLPTTVQAGKPQGLGSEASWILVQIQALPWTSSVTANKSLPEFQSPLRRGGSSLCHCFAISVNKLTHVQYPIQGAAGDIA